jgi:hypothetical protein
MMLDINKLKGKIVEKGKNVEALAIDIGIDSSTFYRKMKNNSFEIGEADRIVKALDLSRDDAMSIFFSSSVAEMRQSND